MPLPVYCLHRLSIDFESCHALILLACDQTLERSYLLKINGTIAERPQHMLMRVSVGIHKEDITGAIETYNLMSQKLFTHASPTLFNAGTPNPQLSSCFLVHMKVTPSCSLCFAGPVPESFPVSLPVRVTSSDAP